MKKTIGIVDDQQLFVKSLSVLINTFSGFTSVLEALNGKELQSKMEKQQIQPQIILVDVNMPEMDGVDTATMLSKKYPLIKLVALSMKDDDITIISMLRAGCCAYLLKDIHPDELEKALEEIDEKGYYNADQANINFRRLILAGKKEEANRLTEKEKIFLQYACSDLTYKQIASKMNLAERTIDGYRESIFEKLNVQSRVGMAMEAIRRKLVNI
jgi:DNA-binding NarL/FixJ family response regulator